MGFYQLSERWGLSREPAPANHPSPHATVHKIGNDHQHRHSFKDMQRGGQGSWPGPSFFILISIFLQLSVKIGTKTFKNNLRLPGHPPPPPPPHHISENGTMPQLGSCKYFHLICNYDLYILIDIFVLHEERNENVFGITCHYFMYGYILQSLTLTTPPG